MNNIDCPQDHPSPFHPKHFSDPDKKGDWTIITFVISMAFGCVMILSGVFIYYQCVRRPEQRLRAAERRHRRRRRAAENFMNSPVEGLGGAMLDSLPVFVYTPENYKEGLRCAVCLCEFQQSEKGRLLPTCNHSFHVDCIGMWFYSHSTCPLCRTKVEKQSDASLQLHHTQMELSGLAEEEEKEDEEQEEEETGEKEVVGNTSVSSAAGQHDNGGFSRQKDDDDCSEEGKGEHVSIDLGHQRKPASCSITSTG